VNSIQCNAFDYYLYHPEWSTEDWADHGHGPAGSKSLGPLPPHAIRWHPEFYRDCGFAHADRSGCAWPDRDAMAELLQAAHERGVTVHARFLEGFGAVTCGLIPGYERVLGADVYGERTAKPCWHHPAYRAWWLATVEDLVTHYALDGLYLGPERDGPLGPVLHDAGAPTCFCEHCCAAARARGVDPERAREGWRKLHRLVKSEERPTDGMLVSILRLWIAYPEILGWEKLQSDGKWDLHAALAGKARSLRPGLRFGLHICMYSLAHDLFARATTDYARLADFVDYVKPSLYTDVNAARLHRSNRVLRQHLWRDLDAELLHEFLYAVMGYDPQSEPDYEGSATGRFGPSYIRREIQRIKAAVDGRADVYSGLGVDVPHADLPPVRAEFLRQAVTASFEAGADGLLLSREYQYMRRESLAAVREAVDEWKADHA
jgi:hypothetical protein